MGAFEYDYDTLLLAIVSYTDPSRLAPTNARKFVFSGESNTSDSVDFDAANQPIWVHLWGSRSRDGCVLYKDYHQNIKKTYFYRPHFPWSLLSNYTLLAIEWTAELGWPVPLADTLLPTVMEFPRAVQMTSRAALKGFPRRQMLGNRRDNTQKTRAVSDCLIRPLPASVNAL